MMGFGKAEKDVIVGSLATTKVSVPLVEERPLESVIWTEMVNLPDAVGVQFKGLTLVDVHPVGSPDHT